MLYIDAQNAGISGDMLIAGLLDLDADPSRIDESLSPIKDLIGRYSFTIKKVKRGIYKSTRYRFNFTDKPISYKHIKNGIKSAGLSNKARKYALSCFETLADAESTIHGVEKDGLHFHDAPDTVSDFTVASALLDDLGLLGSKILSSPVNTGKGFFKFHGQRSTLPAPATAEILKGKPIFGSVEMELTTPTGAALLVNLAGGFVNGFPPIKIEKIGYGAGYKDMDFPNVLKLYKGVDASPEIGMETITQLETNVDTATGEELGYLFERLFDDGALDVIVIPCIMKKNRPGQIVKVVCKGDDSIKLAKILMAETGSLGVRIIPETHRHVLKREIREKRISLNGKPFKVRFKTALGSDGSVVSSNPEFDDVKRIAGETGLSLPEVKKHLKKLYKPGYL